MRYLRTLIFPLALAVITPARAEPPTAVLIIQTVATLAAATDTVLGANPNRRSVCVQNIGLGMVNLNFDAVAVAGSGWALEPPSVAGHQGGAQCWDSTTVARSVIHGISAAGSTVVIIEGK